MHTYDQNQVSVVGVCCISYAPSICSHCSRYYCCLPWATDSAYELAWTLQDVQAATVDNDLCHSYINPQPFSLYQEPPDTFLQLVSSDENIICVAVYHEGNSCDKTSNRMMKSSGGSNLNLKLLGSQLGTQLRAQVYMPWENLIAQSITQHPLVFSVSII